MKFREEDLGGTKLRGGDGAFEREGEGGGAEVEAVGDDGADGGDGAGADVGFGGAEAGCAGEVRGGF